MLSKQGSTVCGLFKTKLKVPTGPDDLSTKKTVDLCVISHHRWSDIISEKLPQELEITNFWYL